MQDQAQRLRELMASLANDVEEKERRATATVEMNNAENLTSTYRLWSQLPLLKEGDIVKIKPGMGVAKPPFDHNNVMVFMGYLNDYEKDLQKKGVADFIVIEEALDCRCGVYIGDVFVVVLINSRRLMRCQ